MTAHLLIRALLGVLLVIALHGWGAMARHFTRLSPRQLPADNGTIGLAVMLAIGGILNICDLLDWPVYLLLFACGLLWAGADFIGKVRRKAIDGKWMAVVAIATLIALPIYFASLNTSEFNPHDDGYSYLVMPTRIAQTGTLWPDPFNYRSIVAGPGGISFLQAPIVRMWGVSAVRLVDMGAGLLLFITAAATLFRRIGVSAPMAIVLLAGALVLVSHPLVNVAGYFMPLALLLAICSIMLEAPDETWSRPIFAAMLLAAVAALKNTAIPFAALLCGMMLIGDFCRKPSQGLRNAVLMFVVFILAITPWYVPLLVTHVHLIALMHGSEGDAVSARYMLWWTTRHLWNWAFLVAFSCVATATAFLSRAKSDRLPILAVIVAVILGSIVTTYATGGVAIARYTQPLFLVAYLLCGGILLACLPRHRFLIAAGICLGLATFRSAVANVGYLQYCSAMINSATPPDETPVQDVRQMQDSMAPGSAALVCMSTPYLLDFRRNRLFVVDFPRAASPDPGFPPPGDDLQFVQYLRAQSIRYVVYGYADEASFPESLIAARLPDPEFTPWQRALNRQVPIFHNQLRSIAARWPKIYDDGRMFVVDAPST
jgi:hypothetical protein